MNTDYARRLGNLLTLVLTPPGFPAGSLAAGSATEDRILDAYREQVHQAINDVGALIPPDDTRARDALAAIVKLHST